MRYIAIFVKKILSRYIGIDNISSYIEAEIKWPTFCMRHLQTHLLEYNDGILTEILLKLMP